jgi:hypothetical protein
MSGNHFLVKGDLKRSFIDAVTSFVHSLVRIIGAEDWPALNAFFIDQGIFFSDP